MSQLTPIPEPPGLPLLGNIADIDEELPLASLSAFADKYGKTWLTQLGERIIFSTIMLYHNMATC